MTSLFRCYHAQRQWMDEIVAVSAVQRRAVSPTLRPTPPRYVPVPTFDRVGSVEGGAATSAGEVGRVDPNWIAIGVGLFVALYVIALWRFVEWVVPELAEFVR